MKKITDYILLTDYNSQRCATVQFVNICNFSATFRITFLLNVCLNVCFLFLQNTHRGVGYVHGLGPGAYDHRPLPRGMC